YCDGERNGFEAVDNASAGILHITNTRLISLKVQKQWSDCENHEDKHITVKLYRSTNINDVPDVIKDNLMLQVPSAVSFGTNSETTVTANKAITSAVSDNENVTVEIDANDATKIIIKSNDTECKATIKVSDGSEEATINVTVSSLEILLNNSTENFTIEAGQTGELSATKDGATFRVVSGGDVVGINGTTLTAKKDGTAVISATANGVTVEQTITVTLPSTFEIIGESEVAEGDTIQLSANPAFGTFTWSSSDEDIATVDENTGEVTGVAAGTVTITATRKDCNGEIAGIAEKEITVLMGAKEITFDDKPPTIDYDKSKPLKKIEVQLAGENGSVQGNWEYITFKFDESNYIKFGYYSMGNDPGFGVEDGISQPSNSSKLTNIEYKITDRAKGIIEITFKDSYQPNSISISQYQNLRNGNKIIIHYASTSTYSVAPYQLSAQSASEDTMLLSEGEQPALTGELVDTKDIKYTDSWTWTKEGLDVYDSNGKPYYYWAVEEEVGGYTAVYSFTDSDEKTSNCLNASSIGEGLITIKNIKNVSEGVTMPSTGGTGTTWYYITGAILVISSGAIGTLRLRRRKKKAA
ncbi:MAG: Ig-like domain-containing protein, partial [Ruminococcus sp.]|nr:Ig-like domain-containing protein [Ruminococcus sp.]